MMLGLGENPPTVSHFQHLCGKLFACSKLLQSLLKCLKVCMQLGHQAITPLALKKH